jgi:hypothetical protein
MQILGNGRIKSNSEMAAVKWEEKSIFALVKYEC